MSSITARKSHYTETPFQFHLPEHLQCSKPTEVRGIRRDEVKLMVSNRLTNQIEHSTFTHFADFLAEGDVLVVNTSGTLKAALQAQRSDGTLLNVHFSTQQANGEWIVELRKVIASSTERFYKAQIGEELTLLNGGKISLIQPYYSNSTATKTTLNKHLQLWRVQLQLPESLRDYLDKYGSPIRYNYVKTEYPSAYYQTVFAEQMGSTEMPSAGRAFTPELLAKLIRKGVQIVPILLHTGVASLENNERPYDEYYEVSESAAQNINLARKHNRRIIAVGTTVIRALETVTSKTGITQSGKGWTNTFITPERGIYGVDALLTGMHEPKASHLLMLEALATREHLQLAYQSAIEKEYLWHEFGDLHLIL